MESGVSEVRPRILDGSFLGELDHPISKLPVRQLTVLYKQASHRILEIGWDGNKLFGVVETLRTPNGVILKNLAEDGIPIGFSFRGMGDLKQVTTPDGSNGFEVIPPLHVVTWDSVSLPSHKEARIIKITESMNQILKNNMSKVLSECVEYKESSGTICTSEGVCYIPNDFDQLVENKVIKLKDKFKI